MNWTLFWQITGPIIASIAIAAVFYYLSHREKVEIKYPHMLAQLQTNEAAGIQFEYWFSLIYVRGARDRYVSEIWVELDKHPWEKLRPYFKIYRRMSRSFGQNELPKLEIGKPKPFGDDNFFPARQPIAKEKLEELDDLVQEIWHRYKIGWRDAYGKAQSKTIHQLKDFRKSFSELGKIKKSLRKSM